MLSAEDQKDLSFDAFFTHILMHELMHGLGPHNITVGGRATTVRQEMKEASSYLEEAKADISGLFALQYLHRQGRHRQVAAAIDLHDVSGVLLPLDPVRHQRSARARHRDPVELPARPGWLLGAVGRDLCGEPPASQGRRHALTREIMTIQAAGDYAKAKELGERLGIVRPPVQAALDKLANVPVDIEPRYVTAAQLVK